MTRRLLGLVVTGTDTGVGKTVVSTGLLRLASRSGVRLVPFKPVETGCPPDRPADALALRAAARRTDLPLDLVCPHRYRPPVAPAAAARRPLTLPALATAARRAAARGDALLIEGAGGLLTPYGARLTIADLAARLGLPVILVARNALGTINHTALCAAELRRRRLPLLGIVLVDVDTDPRAHARERNAELIATVTGMRPVAVPRLPRPTADAAADALADTNLGRAWLRGL